MFYPQNNEQDLSQELFQNPPKEYRGIPFWSWNDELKEDELCRQIGELKEMGFGGGLVRIHHCANEAGVKLLGEHIAKDFPAAKVIVDKVGGLCSYYAEYGGMIIGFELA